MANLNDHERLNLQKMINESECDDNTDHIRNVKHSVLIRDDIRKLDTFKQANRSLQVRDFDKFMDKASDECPFLYTNYTDIFNRIVKDELDLEIMTKLLMVLKMIEDGKVDQHEGSVMVGKVLKELYIDSALKRCEHLDEEHTVDEISMTDQKNISWKDYKQKRHLNL
jgi:hypothetical protein